MRAPAFVGSICVIGLLMLTGCRAFSGENPIATIDADLAMYASESDSLRAVGTAEQIMAVETIAAAGTRIAKLSAVNAALGATLRANQTGTPEIQVAVVSAEDMGSSLEDGMMDDEAGQAGPESLMRVSNLLTADRTDPDSGCSIGTVREFSPSSELIYVTARVTALQKDTLFEVEWEYGGRAVSRTSWRSDYSKSFECIWFYTTPADFPFLPGPYTATLLVNGERLGATEFAIAEQ